jgi:hypothetical protein
MVADRPAVRAAVGRVLAVLVVMASAAIVVVTGAPAVNADATWSSRATYDYDVVLNNTPAALPSTARARNGGPNESSRSTLPGVASPSYGASVVAAEADGDLVRTFSSRAAPIGGAIGVSLEEARTAALRNGIDIRMFELRCAGHAKAGDYAFTSQSGTGEIVRAANGRFVLTLTDSGLASEADAVNSIAHELNHVREILRGPPGAFVEDEGPARLAGDLAELLPMSANEWVEVATGPSLAIARRNMASVLALHGPSDADIEPSDIRIDTIHGEFENRRRILVRREVADRLRLSSSSST